MGEAARVMVHGLGDGRLGPLTSMIEVYSLFVFTSNSMMANGSDAQRLGPRWSWHEFLHEIVDDEPRLRR